MNVDPSLQVSRAANVVHSILSIKRQIDREELQPLLLRNTIPICMSQYERLFSTVRWVNHTTPPHCPNHLRVMDYLFTVLSLSVLWSASPPLCDELGLMWLNDGLMWRLIVELLKERIDELLHFTTAENINNRLMWQSNSLMRWVFLQSSWRRDWRAAALWFPGVASHCGVATGSLLPAGHLRRQEPAAVCHCAGEILSGYYWWCWQTQRFWVSVLLFPLWISD